MAIYPDYNSYPRSGPGNQYMQGPATGGQDQMKYIQNWYGNNFMNNPGMDNARKYMEAQRGYIASNPFVFQPQTMQSYQQFMQDPNLGGGYKQQMDQSYNQLGRAVRGYQGGLAGMRAAAQGRNSVVAQQANAQAQAGMRDIAQQAALQGAAGNPALARTAVMQQAAFGQNMAPQIAAARAQERQAAQQAYMQALQGSVGNYGNLYGAANQMYTGAQSGWGALNNAGLQAHAQATSAFNQNPNLKAR